jgi:hypothetical protein
MHFMPSDGVLTPILCSVRHLDTLLAADSFVVHPGLDRLSGRDESRVYKIACIGSKSGLSRREGS